MTDLADRWPRVSRLFDELADLPAAEQDARIAAIAADDPDIARTVARMLRADRTDGVALGIAGLGEAAALILDEPLLAPGTRVGAFDVVGVLGRGGMGVVYDARDRHLDRPAALKLLPPAGAADGAAAARLLAEAKAASALDHPNVATVYQVGETDDGRPFIAMARYEGESLRQRLTRGPLPAAEALTVARQVASGLAAAHRAGIVHRDVTAANIFLTRDGTVKLLDFGIAVLAGAEDAPGTTHGTVSAMSPEQARGEAADPRTDVWALGIVLHRMLTGRAFRDDDATATRLARLRSGDPIPRPRMRGVPRRLARVIDRAVRQAPDDRYADAGEMLAALEAADGRRAPHWAAVALALAVLGAGAVALRPPAGPDATSEASRAAPVLVIGAVTGPADSTRAERAAAVVDEVRRRLTATGRVHVVAGDSAGDHVSVAAYRLDVRLGGTAGVPQLSAAVHAADGADTLWSATRRFAAPDLRELSLDLTENVLHALGVPLTAREEAALAAGFPASVAAYDELLAGNGRLRIRTPESLLAAMEHYEAAHRLDTTFVSALARHAYTIALLLDWGWQPPGRARAELLGEGMALSGRAVALDSTSAEAWLARAYLMVAADPETMRGAPDAFRRAILLDPYNAEAYHQYAQTAMQLGMFADAATAYRRAIDLQPDAAMALVALGGLEELERRRDRALRYLDSAVAVAPEMPYARAIRGLVRSYAGDYAGARADAEAAVGAGSEFALPGYAVMAIAVQGLGDDAAALGWLTRAEAALADPAAPTPDEAHLLANAQLALDRRDDAVRTVERARPRGASLWYLLQHPALEAFRAEPRVAAVLAVADPRRTRAAR